MIRLPGVDVCHRCHLFQGTVVNGEGSRYAPLMLIGEAPGYDENRTERPWVGKAGRLLRDVCDCLNLNQEEDYYLTNIVKCRPPENRTPYDDEIKACLPWLKQEIKFINPWVIVILGKCAARGLGLCTTQTMSSIRGHWFEYQGIPATVTYHPAATVRNIRSWLTLDIDQAAKKVESIFSSRTTLDE